MVVIDLEKIEIYLKDDEVKDFVSETINKFVVKEEEIFTRKWNSVKETPPEQVELLLQAEDKSTCIGFYMPFTTKILGTKQKFGGIEAGIFSDKYKIINWAVLNP